MSGKAGYVFFRNSESMAGVTQWMTKDLMPCPACIIVGTVLAIAASMVMGCVAKMFTQHKMDTNGRTKYPVK